MKRTLSIITALLTGMAAVAQTLNVSVGSVTDQYPASQAGEMTYTGGSSLTILDKTYTLSDITSMYTDQTTVTNNNVNIVYSGTSALVYVAGNVARYIDVTVSGAHVTISQTNTDAVDDDEITYTLTGTTTDGSLTLGGSYKCTLSLAGVSITNPSGAAINITNKKRIQISAKNGTENTLKDGTANSAKGCIYSKGQLQLQGKGTLNVYAYGSAAHGIKSGDYISVKNLTLNVMAATKDGISCNKYFYMKSGTLTVSGTGDDGIQADLESDDAATGETTDHEDENSGNVYIEDGTLTVSVTAAAAKGIKSEGDMIISGGTVNVTTSGKGTWDSDDKETKAAACLSADGAMTISGGTLTLKSTGSGGKGAKCDGNMTISGGTVNVTTTGGLYYNNGSTENTNYTGDTDRISNSYYSSPKGIKSGVSGSTATNLTISGGTVNVSTAGHNGEGIESKGTLNITDGEVIVNSYDDAINAGSHLTISGGIVYGHATGNDGIDSNGNMYIKGGLVYAVSAGGAEVALDANTEGGYKLYVQGGTIIALGGLENGAQMTQSCYTPKNTTTWNKNTWYAMTVGSSTIAFKTPASGGTAFVVSAASTPTLTSGVTASGTTIFGGMGYTNATVSGGSGVELTSYSGGNSGGGPGGGPGGRW